MKQQVVLIIGIMLLFSISTNGIIAQDDKEQKNYSFWLFSTGNETADGFKSIKLADKVMYNASISKVNQYTKWSDTDFTNLTIDYYYTDDGFILGYNATGTQEFKNGFWYNVTKSEYHFSSLDLNNHSAKIRQVDILNTTDYNLSRNIERMYSYNYSSLIQYTLSNDDKLSAIPFTITADIRDDVGIVILEFDTYTKTINHTQGNYENQFVYDNGTIINTVVPISAVVEEYKGYYMPSLFKAVDITVDAYGLSSLSLQQTGDIGNPFNNKILFDYYIDEEYYNTIEETTSDTSTSTTTSSTTTTTSVTSSETSSETTIASSDTVVTGTLSTEKETPIMFFFSSLIIIIYLNQKRK